MTNDPYAPPTTTVRDLTDVEPKFRWLRIAVFAVLTNAAMVAGVALARELHSRNSDPFASIDYIMQTFDRSLSWGNYALQAVSFIAWFACLAPVRHRRMLHALVLWVAVNVLVFALPLVIPRMVAMPTLGSWMERPGWQLWVPALAIAATYLADRLHPGRFAPTSPTDEPHA